MGLVQIRNREREGRQTRLTGMEDALRHEREMGIAEGIEIILGLPGTLVSNDRAFKEHLEKIQTEEIENEFDIFGADE